MSGEKLKLYFLRHGQADWPGWQQSDDERPLTEAGREEVRAVAQLLVRLEVTPDLVLTSPLPRAAETAEIVAQFLKVECREEKPLQPGFGAPELARLQEKHAGQNLMLVGHEDDFSLTIASLTGGRVKVAKAGVALVELESAERGKLRWLFPPKLATA